MLDCKRMQTILDYQAEQMRKRSRTNHGPYFWSKSQYMPQTPKKDNLSPRSLTFYQLRAMEQKQAQIEGLKYISELKQKQKEMQIQGSATKGLKPNKRIYGQHQSTGFGRNTPLRMQLLQPVQTQKQIPQKTIQIAIALGNQYQMLPLQLLEEQTNFSRQTTNSYVNKSFQIVQLLIQFMNDFMKIHGRNCTDVEAIFMSNITVYPFQQKALVTTCQIQSLNLF